MLQRYLIELFLQSIPETIALSFAVTVFLGVKLEKKKIIGIGVIIGMLIFVLRNIPMITFGFHSILTILIFTILLTKVYNTSSLNSFVATLKTFIALIFYEMIVVNLMLYFFDLNVEELLNDLLLKTSALWIQSIFIVLTAVIANVIINKKEIEEKAI